MAKIQQNVARIMAIIEQTCHHSQRRIEDVCPIVVTKNRTNEEIQEIYHLGFRHFAENRAENLLERQKYFCQEDIHWHLIGPLQKRKVKNVINQISMFHALDRLSIMEEINKRLTHPLDCFLEVNVSGEASKHGFSMLEVKEAYEKAKDYDHIRIVGLMTMAPLEATNEELHLYFQKLSQIAHTLPSENRLLLSMGMSNDYEVAISQGATHLRIGTAWFE